MTAVKKIKIVFVNHEMLFGGAEKALFDLLTLMDKSKFDITVFAQKNTGPWNRKFWEAGIRLIFDYTCRKATLNPIAKLGNVAKRMKIAQAYREDGRGLLDVCCPDADIVVSYSVWENEEMIFAKGAKTVKYIHGDVATNHVYREDSLCNVDMLRRFDRIVCVSNAACQSFKELTGLDETVEMHYNPLNTETVLRLAEEPVDIPEDVPVICAVGRLSAEKGFERLVYVHKRLLEQGIMHKLLLVGDGVDRGFVERMIEMTQTQDTVILAGYQSNPYPYMKRSKFIVNSSFTEGLPVIAMEALCLGVPIVATVPSVGEAFGNEMCGLITENSAPGLEEGIRRMLTDEELYARAKAGAEARSAYFDGKRMVKEIEEMFLSLVEED